MVDEVTEVETPNRNTAHTTVIRENSGGSGAGWLIALVLIVAVIAGIYFFSQTSGSEAAKDNAVANAANNIGGAAQKVGDAAGNAADNAAN